MNLMNNQGYIDDNLAKSLFGLAKYNNGMFKSEKQKDFILKKSDNNKLYYIANVSFGVSKQNNHQITYEFTLDDQGIINIIQINPKSGTKTTFKRIDSNTFNSKTEDLKNLKSEINTLNIEYNQISDDEDRIRKELNKLQTEFIANITNPSNKNKINDFSLKYETIKNDLEKQIKNIHNRRNEIQNTIVNLSKGFSKTDLNRLSEHNFKLKNLIKEVFNVEYDSLLKKWANNIHRMNIIRFNNEIENDEFPQEKFQNLEKSNIEIQSKLSHDSNGDYIGTDWINAAEKYAKELDHQYGLKNPSYAKWIENYNYKNVDEESIRANFNNKKTKMKKKKIERLRHTNKNAQNMTTPRHWSSKFWSTKPVSEILSEIIDPKNVEIDTLKMHSILNQSIWESEKLKPEVRKVLLKNAILFMDFVGIADVKIYDIILTGSMANYNYTKDSDIDLHIIIDFDKIGDNVDIVRELFKEKKDNWSLTKDIKIYGYDVETYLQDINEPNTMGSGIYSVFNDEWVEKPNSKIVSIDKEAIQVKAADIMNSIDSLDLIQDANSGLNKIKKIKERIVKLRKNGLEKEGEFSLENLVFKVLRHTGYIDKLNDAKKQYVEKSLTLTGNNK